MSGAEPIGLIAANGRLPVLIAEGIKAAGRPLVVVGLRDQADPILATMADRFDWAPICRIGTWIRLLRKRNVRQAVLVGGVRKADQYSRWRLIRYLPDLRTLRMYYIRMRHDRRPNAALTAIGELLAEEGISLMSSVEYCPEHLAHEGLMTRTPLPRGCEGDVEFGFGLARASASLDIGQSLAVKERDVLAVEAIEGTDAMIARAGALCRAGGWTLIKVARPKQDMRFDVPCVGPDTIRNLKAAGCRCLVVEAERTIILDKPQTLELADELGVAIVGKKA